MSFSIADFEKKAIVIFNTITSETVIFANQNAPRPSGSYFTLQILRTTQRGEPQETQNDGLGQKVVQWDEMTLQVKAIGEDSFLRAYTARTAMGLRWVVDAFAAAFAGVGQITPLQNVPTVRSNGWDDQSVFDVIFNIVTETSESSQNIISIELEGTIDGRELILD